MTTTTPTISSRAFTGERPGHGEHFEYDEARHRAAYLHARELARGRDVLDAGCGEGFGTVLLAETARSVLAVDYSATAIAAARAAHARPNLEFRQLDLYSLPTLDRRFDLITNFQVLEHLTEPIGFLRALGSVLKPDGMLMLTTPNRLTTVSENPYHVREYTAEELRELLRTLFGDAELASVVGNARVQAFDAERKRQVERILRLDPFGLRKVLPERLVKLVFARLSILVRRRISGNVVESRAITPADFTVVAESRPDALDLVAFCRP
jgi:2-polyprenyl-3-methyl-5-hydroxy-6-metoxy-1,4-benzoquinol methylase